MTRPYHHWTTSDLRVLREHYPAGGVNECMKHLAHVADLSPNKIWKQAKKQGIGFNPTEKTLEVN